MLETFAWIDEFGNLASERGWAVYPIIETVVSSDMRVALRLHEKSVGILQSAASKCGRVQIWGSILDPANATVRYDGQLCYSQPRVFWTRHAVDTVGEVGAPMKSAKPDSTYREDDERIDSMAYKRLQYTPSGLMPDASEITDGDLKLHKRVRDGAARLGCLMTPAPDSVGRALPPGRLSATIRRSRSAGGDVTAACSHLGATTAGTWPGAQGRDKDAPPGSAG